MYDKIHASKVYSEEVIQISNFIIGNFPSARTLKILDFGCGTGVHLANLADESFEVMGYDPNKFMLDLGKMKYPELNFTDDYGSIPNGMDFVYSIFDVASYQVTVEELELFFRQIAGTLRIGGVILIDGWHLHGVKLDPPESRQRSFEIDGIRICRRVEPISGDDFRTTSLHISLINEDNGEVLMREIHTMRAFTSEEISTVAKKVGFNDIHFRDGKDWGKELDNSSWRFMMFAEYLGY
jgi:SAM-dependent methyltransferase